MSKKTKRRGAASPAEPEARLEFVEPEEGIFRTYSNHHRFGWTGYDVRLLFGELVEVSSNEYIIEETAHITMSWIQAKYLLQNLQNLIQKYEAENGPIQPIKVPVL